ncbi:MAG: hypothetical protein Q8N96_16315 [Methylovulum sp.]|nr:hypothetical protein [Methylovulum sp.]
MADVYEIKEEYDIELPVDESQPAVLLVVPHRYFMEKDWSYIAGLLENKTDTILEVKANLDREYGSERN